MPREQPLGHRQVRGQRSTRGRLLQELCQPVAPEQVLRNHSAGLREQPLGGRQAPAPCQHRHPLLRRRRAIRHRRASRSEWFHAAGVVDGIVGDGQGRWQEDGWQGTRQGWRFIGRRGRGGAICHQCGRRRDPEVGRVQPSGPLQHRLGSGDPGGFQGSRRPALHSGRGLDGDAGVAHLSAAGDRQLLLGLVTLGQRRAGAGHFRCRRRSGGHAARVRVLLAGFLRDHQRHDANRVWLSAQGGA
mmetsp:Transcript_111316/g.359190  ORF Transcript_111316/g.359190 Transcript_111316/m.359190 type:complete len:244 (-) Transcript_111316:216-947(-)